MNQQIRDLFPRTTRPCPTWCTMDAGHPFVGQISGTPPQLTRYHACGRTVAGVTVEIEAHETCEGAPSGVTDPWGEPVLDPVGPSAMSRPVVGVESDGTPIEDPAQLLLAARALRWAARTLGELQGQGK